MDKERGISVKKAEKQRLIILSLDAVGTNDLPYLCSLTHFGKFMERAALCDNVKSVYPSLTYPAHTSIVTGKTPLRHGIINNTRFQPKRPVPDWFWQRRYIKGTTLYDEAINAGWKTAALLWPVTAKSRIRYCIPEVLPNRPWQTQAGVMLMNASPVFTLAMYRRFGHLLDGIRQPALDNFTYAAAVETIYRHNPDLFLIHWTDVDTNRHIYGVEHEKALLAVKRHDERIGGIIKALEETGDMEKTTIVLLGDHYQMDTHTILYWNHLLKERGYLTAKGDKITDYKIAAKTCDGSCYLYVHPKYRHDAALILEVTQMFAQFSQEEKYGIDRIFTGGEAGRLGADDTCVIMIEAKKGYYYLDETEVFSRPVREAKKHKMRGTHGYLPDKENYTTFFAAGGYGIRAGARAASMCLCDEGPTLAKLMGLELPGADGRVVEELLEMRT